MPRRTKRQQQSRKQKRGGATSATSYGEELYGPGPHYADPGSNVVHMNKVSGGDPVGANDGSLDYRQLTGGKKQRKGGKVLTDIALPTALIIANQSVRQPYSNRSSKRTRRRSNKLRNSKRFRRSMRR